MAINLGQPGIDPNNSMWDIWIKEELTKNGTTYRVFIGKNLSLVCSKFWELPLYFKLILVCSSQHHLQLVSLTPITIELICSSLGPPCMFDGVALVNKRETGLLSTYRCVN